MKIKHIFAILIIPALFSSCLERDNSEFTDIPVIESYLKPGYCLSLTVSRQIPFSSNVWYASDDINNLTITISNNEADYILEPLGEGRYSDSALIVKGGERYDLSFVYNSMNVSAYTEVPSKPVNYYKSANSISVVRMDSSWTPVAGGMFVMPEPLEISWDNDDDSYYILVAENMEETLDPVRDFGADEEIPIGRFRKSPTTASGVRMMPQEFEYFGTHRLILFHVLPDYASLYDRISSSSQNLTNPSTSITNGYGIFTGLNADTLYLEVKESE
jgi:hypothetical protein